MPPEPSNDRELTAFERASAPLILQLSRLPKWALLVAVLGLTLAGLLLENVIGGLLLLVLAGFVAWLTALGWPRLSAVGRLLRLLVFGLVTFAAITRIL